MQVQVLLGIAISGVPAIGAVRRQLANASHYVPRLTSMAGVVANNKLKINHYHTEQYSVSVSHGIISLFAQKKKKTFFTAKKEKLTHV